MKKRRSGKNFNINVKPRDLLVDVKGLSADAGFAYLKFWMHHHLHGEPLPPREERIDDVDEYFRDLLDMKNVKTWRRARDELVAKARIRVTDDGRYFIGRTMRELGDDDEEPSDGGAGSGSGGAAGEGSRGQTVLPLPRRVAAPVEAVEAGEVGATAPVVAVDKPVHGAVDEAGQADGSGEVRAKFGRTSGEVCPKFGRSSGEVAIQPIDSKRKWVPPFMFSSTPSHFNHEVAAALMAPARARGDPAARA